MPKYTVQDSQSGKTITFDWAGQGNPTDDDFEQVAQSAGLRDRPKKTADVNSIEMPGDQIPVNRIQPRNSPYRNRVNDAGWQNPIPNIAKDQLFQGETYAPIAQPVSDAIGAWQKALGQTRIVPGSGQEGAGAVQRDPNAIHEAVNKTVQAPIHSGMAAAFGVPMSLAEKSDSPIAPMAQMTNKVYNAATGLWEDYAPPAASGALQFAGVDKPLADMYGKTASDVAMLPAFGIAHGLIGKGVDAVKSGAENLSAKAENSLMKQAMNERVSDKNPVSRVNQNVQTALDKGTVVNTKGTGRELLRGLINTVNNAISGAVQGDETRVPIQRIVDALDAAKNDYVDSADLSAIESVKNDVLKFKGVDENGTIGVPELQRFKRLAQQTVKSHRYGVESTAKVEGWKIAGHEARMMLIEQHPELASLNADDAAMFQLDRALKRRQQQLENKHISFSMHGIGMMLLDHPSVQSRLAIALNRARKVLSSSEARPASITPQSPPSNTGGNTPVTSPPPINPDAGLSQQAGDAPINIVDMARAREAQDRGPQINMSPVQVKHDPAQMTLQAAAELGQANPQPSEALKPLLENIVPTSTAMTPPGKPEYIGSQQQRLPQEPVQPAPAAAPTGRNYSFKSFGKDTPPEARGTFVQALGESMRRFNEEADKLNKQTNAIPTPNVIRVVEPIYDWAKVQAKIMLSQGKIKAEELGNKIRELLIEGVAHSQDGMRLTVDQMHAAITHLSRQADMESKKKSMTLYHWSDKQLDVVDPSKSGTSGVSGQGKTGVSYFYTSPNSTEPMFGPKSTRSVRNTVKGDFAILDVASEEGQKFADDLIAKTKNRSYNRGYVSPDEIRDAAKKAGYDGVMDSGDRGVLGKRVTLFKRQSTATGMAKAEAFGKGGNPEPNEAVRDNAAGYMRKAGMEYLPEPDFVKVDPAKAKEIADAYEAAKHDPKNPEVKSSYDAFKKETLAQWNYLKSKGVKFEAWTGEGQPYKNSAEMRADVANGHLYFFTGGEIPKDHPLAAKAPGTGLTYNDVFRAVHDYFGHAKEGYEFGPRGEENAWKSHSEMYSPEARRAMTTETRGQNSWVNYGPHGEANRANPANTRYADQKAALLPEEHSTTGVSSVRLLDHPLLRADMADENTMVADIADALIKHTRNRAGMPETERAKVERAVQSGMPELQRELAMDVNGIDWYSKNVNDALNTLQEVVPELSDLKNRGLFAALTAVLSPQRKVAENLKLAVDNWLSRDENGKFPTDYENENGESKQYNIVNASIPRLNAMISELGVDGFLQYIQTKHPVREMKAKWNKSMAGSIVGEEYGSHVFGPKVGEFMQALLGNKDAVTIDTWATRTIHRWLGKDLNYDKDGNVRSVSQVDRRIAKQAITHIANQFGMSPADAQAVLWNYEKSLYEAQGYPAHMAAKISFKEAADAEVKRRTDFEFGGDAAASGSPEGTGQAPVTGEIRKSDGAGSEGVRTENAGGKTLDLVEQYAPRDEIFENGKNAGELNFHKYEREGFPRKVAGMKRQGFESYDLKTGGSFHEFWEDIIPRRGGEGEFSTSGDAESVYNAFARRAAAHWKMVRELGEDR